MQLVPQLTKSTQFSKVKVMIFLQQIEHYLLAFATGPANTLIFVGIVW
jgi:hypothetical protein